MNKKSSTILILDDQQVNKMAECLPKICESMCGFKQYRCKEEEGKFRLNTTGSCRGARLYLDKQYISLSLVDLQYLSWMFHVFQNQLNAYILSLPDVMAYTTTAYISVNFIEPPPNANKHFLYPQLFEELKTIL